MEDFIVEHRIDYSCDLDIFYITISCYVIYFDASACKAGQGISIVLVSPRGVAFDFSSQLEFYCTNNQGKYEALIFDLELLKYMGVRHVRVFGDSRLVVQ